MVIIANITLGAREFVFRSEAAIVIGEADIEISRQDLDRGFAAKRSCTQGRLISNCIF